MKINWRTIQQVAGIVFVAFLVALGVRTITRRPAAPAAGKNPFEYDVEKYKRVPPDMIGYEETGSIQLPPLNPRALAIDAADRVHVVGDRRWLVFDDEGKTLLDVALSGEPYCLDVAENGEAFIVIDDHLEVFDENGRREAVWPSFPTGAVVTAVAAAKDRVAVADAEARFVRIYDRDGNQLGKIGGKRGQEGVPGFIVPSPYFDLLINRRGRLLVVNPGRHRLEQFDFDGSLISGWGRAGMGLKTFCGCCNPTFIAELSDGSVATSEKGLPRVKVYDSEGRFLTVVAGPERFDDGATGLDLAVDARDRILVLDPKRRSIRIFEKTKATNSE